MTDYGHELEFGYFLSPEAGAPARTLGQSLEALEEAIVILRARWSTAGVLGFRGRRCELEGARPGPKPAHPICNRSLATVTSSRLRLAVGDLVLAGAVPSGLLPEDAPAFHEVRPRLR